MTSQVRVTKTDEDFTVVVDGQTLDPKDNWTFAELEQTVAGRHPLASRNIIWSGAICGWKIKVLSEESLTLVAPDGKGLTLSARRPPKPRVQVQMLDTIKQHGDPLRVGMVEAFAKEGYLPDFVMDVEFEKREPRVRHEKPKPPPVPPVRVSGRAQVVPPLAEELAKPSGPHIISEAPFLAHWSHGSATSPGHRYQSESIIERKWSDGTVDYRCALCEFSRDKIQGIKGHWQTHIRDGSAERTTKDKRPLLIADPEYIEPMTHRNTYTPRASRVKALAEFLKTLDGSPEDVAEAVLEWLHEQSSSGSLLSAESEPLTEAEIIDRIRRLVDRGEYMEQRKEAEENALKIHDLTEHISELEAKVKYAEERALRFEEFATFTQEMAQELMEQKS